MSKKEFASYTFYFALTFLILSTHWFWNFSVRSYIEPAVSPVHYVYRSVGSMLDSGFQYLRSREQLTSQLETLRKRNKQLKSKVYRGKAALRENAQLRDYFDLPSKPSGRFIPVEVYRQNLSGWERTLRVNRGSESGLRKYQLTVQVLNDTWVVRGRVHSVSDHHSLIVLSSDPRFKIGARIEGVPGRQFVARGWGYRGMRIANFPTFLSVKPGSDVYTSSGSTLTPDKLLLGEVKRVGTSDDASDIGRSLTIKPPRYRNGFLLWVVSENE
ncbi:MAG: rod shape-determining protein MreC [bacterium]